jgi:hypothetical protein
MMDGQAALGMADGNTSLAQPSLAVVSGKAV